MNAGEAVDLAREALLLLVAMSLPVLLATLIVATVVGVLQAATQVQDLAISFVPKILAAFAAVLLFGPWILQRLVEFGRRMFALP